MRRLLVFLKYPTPGKVKTRLAASLGDQAASDIARACTELTLQRLGTLRYESLLYVDPPDAIEAARAWLGEHWLMRPQQGATLGERLASASGEAFAKGAHAVILIGTDSPWLASADFERAFDELANADVVIGPTEDGGYYLIGLSRPLPALFEAIAWGTEAVYQQTLKQAQTLGLRVQTLPLGYDVDRREDVARIETLLRHHRLNRREECLS